MNHEMLDAKLKDEYRDLLMLRERMQGATIKSVAVRWGCTDRTASWRIRSTGYEMMQLAMKATQADPEHPANARFTVEDFTGDPRSCMAAMMRDTIAKLEREFPALMTPTTTPSEVKDDDPGVSS